jgi:hypothetical protein
VTLHQCADVRQLSVGNLHGRIGQILAGAEGASGAGQDQDADPGIPLDSRQRAAELHHGFFIEAVQLVGPVQRDRGHSALERQFDVSELHGELLSPRSAKVL